MANSVCAVVVAYYPDTAALQQTLDEIAPQVACTALVNNGPADSLQNIELKDVELIQLDGNQGIAAAHNSGIHFARRRQCEFVLLLDQDSRPAPDMVEQLLAPFSTPPATDKPLSSTGPQYVDPDTAHESFFVQFGAIKFRRAWCGDNPNQRLQPADFLISSGSLIPLAVLDKVGEMDESLFIDHVDTEWHLRANAAGFQAWGVCPAKMHHSLGNDSVRLWLGRWRQLPKHSPLRHYYSVRNSLLLYKRDYADRRWRRNDLLRLLVLFVFVLLSHDQKMEHLKMMMLGLRHGFQGRSGSFTP